MIPKKRIPTHPGQILLEEFLTPMDIPQTRLAEHLKIPVQRINELVNGKRGITPETAWLLAAAFKTSPDFWMNLQTQHDLAKNRPTNAIEAILQRSPRPDAR
jgi:addiction module HigA family antidote